MVVTKIRIADTPEARKDAFEVDRPACWKSRGAYCRKMLSPVPKILVPNLRDNKQLRKEDTYIEYTINTT